MGFNDEYAKRSLADKGGETVQDTSKMDTTADARANAKRTKGGGGSGSFGAAFKAARAGGGKSFTWNGKSYSTAVKGGGGGGGGSSSASSSSPKAAAPAAKGADSATWAARHKTADDANAMVNKASAFKTPAPDLPHKVRSGLLGLELGPKVGGSRGPIHTGRDVAADIATPKTGGSGDDLPHKVRGMFSGLGLKEGPGQKGGGKVKKMAGGGDVDNLEKNFDREFVSKEVVQDTSKMDRSADDAANAKLFARQAAKRKTGGGKPPDSKSAMGKPSAPTPSSKSRAADPPTAKKVDYPVRNKMPAAKAAPSYPNRSDISSQGKARKEEGFFEKGRRLAKAAPGYAKGGAMKSEAADKNFKGKGNPFAKKGAKPFGKKSNPFGSNQAPPFAKGKPFAKGGKIDGCAIRGKTKAKRSR